MENWERDLHVARIVAGYARVRVRDQLLLVGQPSREVRYRAAEIYRDLWQQCHIQGVLTNDELLVIMQAKKLWSPKDEEQRVKLTDAVEDMKLGLFENWAKSNARFAIRNALKKGRAELERLEAKRHGLDYLTCEGVASSGRVRYLTGYSLTLADGRPYWTSEEDWNKPDEFVEEVIEELVRTRLVESEYRELSRNDPWRSLWSARKFCGRGVFDAPSVDMTDEQRYLMMWSNIYESVREHPDCPDDNIMEDDDMMDGWMIKQKREKDANRAKKKGDDIRNEKIRSADEVFVPAQTVEDARRVEKLNDNVAQTIKAQRLATLKAKGEVSEMQMPDTWQRFQGEMAKMQSERIRQTKQ